MSLTPLEAKKNKIANEATKVFLAKGYKTSSLKDIADKTGITKAGLYHYFKSKEEILWYVINRLTARFIKELANCAKRCEEEGLPPEEALRNYITTYAYELNRSRDVPLLILRERHQLTGKYAKELLRRERNIFHGIKSQLSKIPQISDRYDVNVIAFLIISMSHWLGYWLHPRKELDLRTAIDESVNMIFYGIFR